MTAIYEPPTDRAAARRADKSAAAEQDRLDRRDAQQAILARQKMHLDAQLEQARLDAEQRRADKSAAAEQKRVDAEVEQTHKDAERKRKVGEKARRRQLAAARRAKRTTWLKANASVPFVGLVMVCSVVPAAISQVGALSGAGVNVGLAALLATMLEGAAWAVTFMGAAAEKQGKPAAKYRAATWFFASLAAAVNLLHGWTAYPDSRWVAIVLAASSLVAVGIWDLKQHHGKAKTKEEKRERKAKISHDKVRRLKHPQVAALADAIVAAHPFGAITFEDAWAQAWVAVHGTTWLGQTPDIRAGAVQSAAEFVSAHNAVQDADTTGIRRQFLDTLYTPTQGIVPALGGTSPIRHKRNASSQVANQMTPPAEKVRKPRPAPPVRRKGDTPKYHPAANVAASEAARERLAADAQQ